MNFSIVTPSLRQPEWLRLCLGSVADQEAGAGGMDGLPGAGVAVTVDHVVQDACSGEAVRDVCAEFPNVRLFQERDAGMYDAVNRGWRRGSGEICAYLNCDEQYLPGALAAVQTYFAEHPEVDLLFGDVIVVDPTGEYICNRALTPRKHHTHVCHLNTYTAAMFFRRRILDDPAGYFDAKWRNYGDAVWVLQMIERGVRMAVLRQYLSVFTDTGVNMNLNEEGRQEFARFRGSAAAWVRALAPLWVAHHRVRRLVHGLYERSPLEYCIFTSADPKRRACFEVEKSTPIWRDRLAWTR